MSIEAPATQIRPVDLPTSEILLDDGVGECSCCGDRLERGQEVVRQGRTITHADPACMAGPHQPQLPLWTPAVPA